MNDDLETELLAKARSGDPIAAPFLVSCFGESLLGYARAHAPDLSDADRERIVELAIEAGVRAIDRFDPTKGTLRSWFRGQIRFRTLAWRRATPPSAAPPPELEDPPPEVGAEDTAITGALRRAIARLDHDDQVILALRSAEQLAFAEIAQRLEITETAARQRHHRALQRLRREAGSEEALRHLSDGGRHNE